MEIGSLKDQERTLSYDDKLVGSNEQTGEVKTFGKGGKTMKVEQPLQNSSSNNNIIYVNNQSFDFGTEGPKSKLGVTQETHERSGAGVDIMHARQSELQKVATAANALIDEMHLPDVNLHFSAEQLFANVTGKYNVGELKLKSDGSLAHVNSHAGALAAFNNEKLTPEQNLEVRKHVCAALLDKYGANENIGAVVKLLLNENDRYTPLSRDEVFFLFMMIAAKSKSGDLGADQNDLDRYTVENFENLHKFKMGLLTDDTDPSTVTAKTFVKGLQSKDPVVKSIASALTVNAQQNLVSSVLDDLKREFLRGNPGNGHWDYRSFDEHVKSYGNLFSSNDIEENQYTVTKEEINWLFEAVKKEGQPKSRLIRSEQEKLAFVQNCKKNIYEMLKEKISLEIRKKTFGGGLILDEEIKISDKKEKKIVNKQEDKKEIKKEKPKDNVEANKNKATELLKKYEKEVTEEQQQALTNIDYENLAKLCKVTTPEKAKQFELVDIEVLDTGIVKAEFHSGSWNYKISVDTNGKVEFGGGSLEVSFSED